MFCYINLPMIVLHLECKFNYNYMFVGGFFMETTTATTFNLDSYLDKLFGNQKDVVLKMLHEYYLVNNHQPLEEPTFYVFNSYPSFGLTEFGYLIGKAYSNLTDLRLDKSLKSDHKMHNFVLKQMQHYAGIKPFMYFDGNNHIKNFRDILRKFNNVKNNSKEIQAMPYMFVLNVDSTTWKQLQKELSQNIPNMEIQGFIDFPCSNENTGLDFSNPEVIRQLVDLSK